MAISEGIAYKDPVTNEKDVYKIRKEENNKNKLFYCDLIRYGSDGRINYISFKEMSENQIAQSMLAQENQQPSSVL